MLGLFQLADLRLGVENTKADFPVCLRSPSLFRMLMYLGRRSTGRLWLPHLQERVASRMAVVTFRNLPVLDPIPEEL